MIWNEKKQKYPMQLFAGEALILFFRVAWIPTSILSFMVAFEQYTNPMIVLFILSTLMSIGYGYANIPRFWKAFYTSVYNLRIKASYFKSIANAQKNPEIQPPPPMNNEDIPYIAHKDKVVLKPYEKILLELMSKVKLSKERGGHIVRGDSINKDQAITAVEMEMEVEQSEKPKTEEYDIELKQLSPLHTE